MHDARGPGWVRGCRTGPDPCQSGGGLPGPPPGKGTRPRWALGALDVSPLVGHLCSGDQAMRFRKNPSLPARLPVTAPAEASKRLGPAPAPWDSHGGRRRLSEGCAVFEDGWLSPCAPPIAPTSLPITTSDRSALPPSRLTALLGRLGSASPTTLRPGCTGLLWPLHLPRGHGSKRLDEGPARPFVPDVLGAGSREEGCSHAPSRRVFRARRLQPAPRAVTSPSRQPHGPAPQHGPPRKPASQKIAQC